MGSYFLRNVLALGLGMAPIVLGGTIEFGVTDLASNATDPALVNAWGDHRQHDEPFLDRRQRQRVCARVQRQRRQAVASGIYPGR